RSAKPAGRRPCPRDRSQWAPRRGGVRRGRGGRPAGLAAEWGNRCRRPTRRLPRLHSRPERPRLGRADLAFPPALWLNEPWAERRRDTASFHYFTASATALATSRRSRVTFPLSSGWTRLVRIMTAVLLPGSTQIDVPVNPVCP